MEVKHLSLDFPAVTTGWYTSELTNEHELKYSISEIKRIQELFRDPEYLQQAIEFSLEPRNDKDKIINIINTFIVISRLTKTPIKSACLKQLLQRYYGYDSNIYNCRINVDEVMVFDVSEENAKIYTVLRSLR